MVLFAHKKNLPQKAGGKKSSFPARPRSLQQAKSGPTLEIYLGLGKVPTIIHFSGVDGLWNQNLCLQKWFDGICCNHLYIDYVKIDTI